ncbi:MAG: hypothetical protein JWQ25_444 [Daejeonella sp.]|nr:hypothetical protein [Daejeonella sp.]
MKVKNYIIITGDISGFTTIPDGGREKLMSELLTLISLWVKEKKHAGIFRGDSFQLLFDDAKLAIQRTIQIRCWLKMNSQKGKKMLDAKMALGIGEISYSGKTVLDSDGEAFHLSGRGFEDLTDDDSWRIITKNKDKNEQLKVIMSLANVLVSDWTINQAEVIYWLLEGQTQQQMAGQLNIAQSAVNNRLKLSRWKEIEKATRYVATLIEKNDDI